MIFMWSLEFNQKQVCESLGLNKNTVSKTFLKLRGVCAELVEFENYYLGGLNSDGTAIDVEIDESLFFKRKFNRGRMGSIRWVFGAFERQSGKCFLIPVEDRSARTLLAIIFERIRPGSRIISEQLAAYNGIINSGLYDHRTVNHFLILSLPKTLLHTQNIENLWCHVKRKLRLIFGTSEENLESYFLEFVFRKRCKKQGFSVFNEMLIGFGVNSE
jgi:transposase-like protein